MPLESWIQHSGVNEFLYDWQTVIAGFSRWSRRSSQCGSRCALSDELPVERWMRSASLSPLSFDSKSPERSASIVTSENCPKSQNAPITAKMVERMSRMPAPIIYSANAGKIGLLEGDAIGVVTVYTMLEGARGRVSGLATNYRTPDDIPPAVVMDAGASLSAPCKHARDVLLKLRTGDASYDDQDERIVAKDRRRPRRHVEPDRMIRIAISAEAFEAIARTLPFGSMSFENKTNERG